jgi:spore coat protein U-like protein
MKRAFVLAWLLRALLALAALAATPAAQAACGLPLCSCSVSTTGVAFSQYQPFTSSTGESVGNVHVACVGVGLSIPYSVALSKGSSGSYVQRTMKYGSYPLNYALFMDSGYTQPWGDGTGGTYTKDGTIAINVLGIGPAYDHTIYGVLPAGQKTAVPGSYTDTITVTLTYY